MLTISCISPPHLRHAGGSTRRGSTPFRSDTVDGPFSGTLGALQTERRTLQSVALELFLAALRTTRATRRSLHQQEPDDDHPDQGVPWGSRGSRWVGHRCSRYIRAHAQSFVSHIEMGNAWTLRAFNTRLNGRPRLYSVFLKPGSDIGDIPETKGDPFGAARHLREPTAIAAPLICRAAELVAGRAR